MICDWERKLDEATRTDFSYQKLLHECGRMSAEYARIKNSLTREDQAALEQYISLCEEMEYRRTCIAYALGTQKGVQHRCAVFCSSNWG